MELKIQIMSIVFSLLYGALYGLFYNFNYDFLYRTSLRYKILNNFLFSINIFLIYFIMMLKINNGDVRIIFIILMLLSFIISIKLNKESRKTVNYLKNKKKGSKT